MSISFVSYAKNLIGWHGKSRLHRMPVMFLTMRMRIGATMILTAHIASASEVAWAMALRHTKKTGFKIDVFARERAYCVSQWNATADRIFDAAQRLKNVQIENRPAVDLIRRFNHSNVLIYADPPYLLNTRGGKQYRCEMTSEEDHNELLDVLLRHKGYVILSGYHSELYDDTLRGWSVVEHKTHNQNADMRTEVLWCNFDLPQLSMNWISDDMLCRLHYSQGGDASG